MVDPLNINRMADPLDYVRNRNKQYWESYERSLRGGEWRNSLNQTSGLHFDWSDIIQLILEVTLCILLALLLLVLYFCLNKRRRHHSADTENVWPDPPTYEDVIKKDNLELDSLEDLPTYLDAVKQESERKSTV